MAGTEGAPHHRLLFRGGTLVDAEGARTADLLVEDGKIVRAGAEASRAPGPGVRVVDCAGKWITPGLIDCHVHLVLDAGPNIVASLQPLDVQLAIHAVTHAEATLQAGITTVRDLGSRGNITVALREAINRGRVLGPRILAACNLITMTGGHVHFMGREADGIDDCRKATREQLKAGADVIKVIATGGVLTVGADTKAAQLEEDEIRCIVQEARKAGRRTAAHAHGVDGIMNAARAGVASIEHGTYMDRRAAAFMSKHGTYWVPTSSALYAIIEHGAKGIPAESVRKAQHALSAHQEAYRIAKESGVPVAMGTDAGTPFNPHGANAGELQRMVDHGMTPQQALAAATTGAADLLGIGDKVGRLSEGLLADLLVVDADPLASPGAFTQGLHAVYKEGRHVPSASR